MVAKTAAKKTNDAGFSQKFVLSLVFALILLFASILFHSRITNPKKPAPCLPYDNPCDPLSCNFNSDKCVMKLQIFKNGDKIFISDGPNKAEAKIQVSLGEDAFVIVDNGKSIKLIPPSQAVDKARAEKNNSSLTLKSVTLDNHASQTAVYSVVFEKQYKLFNFVLYRTTATTHTPGVI